MPTQKKQTAAAKKKTSTTKKKTSTAKKKTSTAKKANTGTAKKKASTAKKANTGTTLSMYGFAPYKEKRGEEFMNKDQREHFKNLLLAWKQELMEEVDRTVTHMKDEASNFPDPADRATQEEEFSLELRTRDRERKLIKKIDSTIERIDLDDYGFCDQCGVEIGIRRLEARPTANLCVDCKTLDEIKERQITGG
nr:RNA polymerase-binding transcription factor DksA-like [Nerophis lumbriciformis]